ncbi:hypothetical protein ACW2QC_09435 [Virgibacillus sp. FSP13]
MEIKIINVNFRHDREWNLTTVDVQFNCISDAFRNLTGGFELSPEQYAGNETNDKLVAIAKQRLVEGLK